MVHTSHAVCPAPYMRPKNTNRVQVNYPSAPLGRVSRNQTLPLALLRVLPAPTRQSAIFCAHTSPASELPAQPTCWCLASRGRRPRIRLASRLPTTRSNAHRAAVSSTSQRAGARASARGLLDQCMGLDLGVGPASLSETGFGVYLARSVRRRKSVSTKCETAKKRI